MKDTSNKKLIKLAMSLKALTASVAGYAYFSENIQLMAIVGLIGAIANEVINYLGKGE